MDFRTKSRSREMRLEDIGQFEQESLLRTISLSTMLIMLGGVTLMTSLIMGFLALQIREQRS